jgi:type IV pilus assembly protein PilM
VPDVESVELDFQILDAARTSAEMNVLLVAAKRDLVDAKLRILADAGVVPTIVDVDAFALHNAFEANYPEAMKGFVCLVNVGNEVTNVNIMDNGVPILTRDLPLGTRRFSEDLQRQHGMAARDAENLIRGYDRSPQLDSVLTARVEEIAVGVERAAGFLATSRNAALRAVYICGGGSRTPGLDSMLGDRLRITVEHANPLARLNIKDGALDSLTTDEVAPLLMLPIGLALRH